MTGTKYTDPLQILLKGDHRVPTLAVVLMGAAKLVIVWSQRRKTRQDLEGLCEHSLKDIGITREQAEQESLKRFWMP